MSNFFNIDTPDPLLAAMTGGKAGSFLPFMSNQGSTQVGPGTLDLNSLVAQQNQQPGSAMYNYMKMMQGSPTAQQIQMNGNPQFAPIQTH
jgi:hypothetical protein